MVCTSLGSLLGALFYFLCSNLKAHPVEQCAVTTERVGNLCPCGPLSLQVHGEGKTDDVGWRTLGIPL